MATQQERYRIAAAIADNLEGEGDALKKQQELMSLPGLESADLYQVKEISADEANHALIYQAMFRKYSGISPTPDGAGRALEYIAQGIKGGDGG